MDDGIGGIAITGWPFLISTVAVALAVLLGLVLLARVAGRLRQRPLRAAVRTGTAAIAVLLVLPAVSLVVVNDRLDYLRTVDDVLGTGPAEQAGLAQLLLRRSVPEQGVVTEMAIPGSASGFDARPAVVWVPPAWFARPRPALPVIVLLHGTPGRPADWVDSGGAAATADAWAAAHGGTAPILVMPDINGGYTTDSECVDTPGARVETYLTVDVPRVVTRLLGARPPGRAWAVAGLSEGGSCSAQLALRYPELFGTFGDYSGLLGPRVGDGNDGVDDTVTALFGGSQAAFAAHEPADLLGTRRYPDTGGWFEAGTADADPATAARRLAPLAERAGIDTHLVLVPGAGHDFFLFSQALSDSFAWMAGRVSAPAP